MSDTPNADPQPRCDRRVEPGNSTVNDWHGQEVDADVEAAERAMAASRFVNPSRGADGV